MNLLANALRAETLDESLAPIMRAIGIRTGDCAAVVFSSLPQDWPDMTLESRGAWLLEWFKVELLYAACEVMEAPDPS